MNIIEEIVSDVATIYTKSPEWIWIQETNFEGLQGAKFTDVIAFRTNKLEVVFARQLTYYFLCKYTRLSLKAIGALFCAKKQDHSTVINGRNLINDLIDSSAVVRNMVNQIDEIIRSNNLIQHGKIIEDVPLDTFSSQNRPQLGFLVC